MKFAIASILLAASSAFAAPAAETPRATSIQITELKANVGLDATMHFVVTDANFPDDTPTDCNLIWSYGSSPKQNARCNNNYYQIGFPEGVKDLHKFKLSLNRDPDSPITERGQVSVDSTTDGSKWKCVDNPEEHVEIRCHYEGTLNMPVSV